MSWQNPNTTACHEYFVIYSSALQHIATMLEKHHGLWNCRCPSTSVFETGETTLPKSCPKASPWQSGHIKIKSHFLAFFYIFLKNDQTILQQNLRKPWDLQPKPMAALVIDESRCMASNSPLLSPLERHKSLLRSQALASAARTWSFFGLNLPVDQNLLFVVSKFLLALVYLWPLLNDFLAFKNCTASSRLCMVLNSNSASCSSLAGSLPSKGDPEPFGRKVIQWSRSAPIFAVKKVQYI